MVEQEPLSLLLMDNKTCGSVRVWFNSGATSFLGMHEKATLGLSLDAVKLQDEERIYEMCRGREAKQGLGVMFLFACVYFRLLQVSIGQVCFFFLQIKSPLVTNITSPAQLPWFLL